MDEEFFVLVGFPFGNIMSNVINELEFDFYAFGFEKIGEFFF